MIRYQGDASPRIFQVRHGSNPLDCSFKVVRIHFLHTQDWGHVFLEFAPGTRKLRDHWEGPIGSYWHLLVLLRCCPPGDHRIFRVAGTLETGWIFVEQWMLKFSRRIARVSAFQHSKSGGLGDFTRGRFKRSPVLSGIYQRSQLATENPNTRRSVLRVSWTCLPQNHPISCYGDY